MSFTFEAPVVRVSTAFAAKRNMGNYQSMDAHRSVSIEFNMPDGTSVQEVEAAVQALDARLDELTKALVAVSLDVSLVEVKDGVYGIDLGEEPAPKRAPAAKAAPAKRAAAPKQQYEKSNIDYSACPVYDTDEFGEVRDQRPLLGNGIAPNAPAFKQVKGNKAWWITTKDGAANDAALAELAYLGILV